MSHCASAIWQTGRNAFREHPLAFEAVGSEAAAGEEPGAIAHHDGYLAKLADVVECARQGLIARAPAVVCPL